MKKSAIIGIVIVGLIVIVLGFFLFNPNGLFKTSEDSSESTGFQENERTIWVCERKIEMRLTDEEIDDVEKCTVTPIYSSYV